MILSSQTLPISRVGCFRYVHVFISPKFNCAKFFEVCIILISWMKNFESLRIRDEVNGPGDEVEL